MQTQDKLGIICDICGGISRNKFIYYSASFDKVEVDTTLKSILSNIDKRNIDLDICEKCLEEIKNKVLIVASKQGHKIPSDNILTNSINTARDEAQSRMSQPAIIPVVSQDPQIQKIQEIADNIKIVEKGGLAPKKPPVRSRPPGDWSVKTGVEKKDG